MVGQGYVERGHMVNSAIAYDVKYLHLARLPLSRFPTPARTMPAALAGLDVLEHAVAVVRTWHSLPHGLLDPVVQRGVGLRGARALMSVCSRPCGRRTRKLRPPACAIDRHSVVPFLLNCGASKYWCQEKTRLLYGSLCPAILLRLPPDPVPEKLVFQTTLNPKP